MLIQGLLERPGQHIETTNRMGAKVEGEGYRPGRYAVGDLNAGADGWRSLYEEEKTSDEQLCNGSMTPEAIGCTDYDREMFKRTMLAHEAVFRQQVRWYRLLH
jgi:hypothetical protein